MSESACLHSGYLNCVVHSGSRNLAIDRLKKILLPVKDKFDAIAVTGISGVSLGTVIAYLLDKPLIVIRKETDTANHSGRKIESYGYTCRKSYTLSPAAIEQPLKTYVIVDDCNGSGTTIRTIKTTIEAEHGAVPLTCVGEVMYAGWSNAGGSGTIFDEL